MAAYIGPLLLVLVGLGGLIFLIGWRVRSGTTTASVSPDPAAERASHEVQPPATRTRFSWITAIGKRLLRSLMTVGRGGQLVFRVAGRVMRVVFRRPLARVPSVTTAVPSSASEFSARPLPLPAADSVTAPPASEPRTVRPRAESTSESLDVLDELAPQQREISIPKSWAPRPLSSAGERATPRAEVPDDQEEVTEIAPLPRVSPFDVSSSDQGSASDTPSPELPPAAPNPPMTADTEPEEVVKPETAPVTPAPEPLPEETPPLALEPHVRERAVGRQKVVGRVRPLRKGEHAPSQTHVISASERDVAASVTEVAAAGIESIPALLERGQLARAEDVLTELLSVNPGDLPAYRWLALVHLERGEYAQAREVCEEGLRRNPGEDALYSPLGRAYIGLGQYGKALQMYQQAHNNDETNLEYLEQLLILASRMDHRALVRVTAQKILALQPEHALAKKYLARAGAVA